jgi:hypothetical protein
MVHTHTHIPIFTHICTEREREIEAERGGMEGGMDGGSDRETCED